jgi:hypothetical protein
MGLENKLKEYSDIIKANPNLATIIEDGNVKRNKEIGPITVSRILEQSHESRWAKFTVTRKETDVRIEWKFLPSMAEPLKFIVFGHMREMSLIPDPSYDTEQLIALEDGNGSVNLGLEEGQSYYFQFIILNNPKCDLKNSSFDYADIIYFQVSVPLADENKIVVRRALESEHNSTAKIRYAAEKLLEQKDAFDQMVEEGITRIEAKNLPPKIKREKIKDWKEDIEQLKEKFGM